MPTGRENVLIGIKRVGGEEEKGETAIERRGRSIAVDKVSSHAPAFDL